MYPRRFVYPLIIFHNCLVSWIILLIFVHSCILIKVRVRARRITMKEKKHKNLY